MCSSSFFFFSQIDNIDQLMHIYKVFYSYYNSKLTTILPHHTRIDHTLYRLFTVLTSAFSKWYYFHISAGSLTLYVLCISSKCIRWTSKSIATDRVRYEVILCKQSIQTVVFNQWNGFGLQACNWNCVWMNCYIGSMWWLSDIFTRLEITEQSISKNRSGWLEQGGQIGVNVKYWMKKALCQYLL